MAPFSAFLVSFASFSLNPNWTNAAASRRQYRGKPKSSNWSTCGAETGCASRDIQNARRIIGDGPGWVDRLEAALKAGAVLPAVAVAIYSAALQDRYRQR
jgi:hypothetical protein